MEVKANISQKGKAEIVGVWEQSAENILTTEKEELTEGWRKLQDM
jgi:hypothetical protein